MQAAGGTSLTRQHPVSSGQPAARTRYLLLIAAVAAVAYAADQVTKYLAVAHLTDRPDVTLIGETLQLHLTYNPGAAFSLGGGFTRVISVVAIIAVLVILVLALRVRNRLWAAGLGILLGGVAGNLTDRLFRAPGPLEGYVVDFLMLPHWPVFNVADVCINIAAGVIILQSIRGIRMDGTREERPAKRKSRGEEA